MMPFRVPLNFALSLGFLLITFVVDSCASQATPKIQSAREALLVEIADGRVSVETRNAPLVEVLKEIEKETDLPIRLDGTIDTKLSIRFRRLPLEAGLRRLLSGYNFVLSYDSHSSLSAVEVLSYGARGARETGHVRGTAQGTKDPVRRRTREKGDSQKDGDLLRRIGNQALNSPSVITRADAVDDLYFADDEEYAAKILTGVLRHEADSDIRERVLDALESFDDIPSQPVLEASVHDEDPGIRVQALEVIEDEEWADVETIDTLTTALQDTSPDVRLLAVEILGDLEQLGALEFAAYTTQDSEVRELALEFLSGL